MMRRLTVSAIVALMALLGACTSQEPELSEARVVVSGGRIFIVDNTGKKWDVTHAVNEYGFEAAKFEFGLGPNAIKPINNPEFVSPGDPGYPSASSTFRVIGADIGGDSRAYPISVLNRYEIVNDVFGDAYVTVGW